MPRKAAPKLDSEGQPLVDGSEALGAGRQLRVRQPKAYLGQDDDPVVEEEEVIKKGKKRGRPPKVASKSAPRDAKKKPVPPVKLRPLDPPVPPDRLENWRQKIESLPDDAVVHNLPHLLPEAVAHHAARSGSELANVSEKTELSTPERSRGSEGQEAEAPGTDAADAPTDGADAPGTGDMHERRSSADALVAAAAPAVAATLPSANRPIRPIAPPDQVLRVPADALSHLLQARACSLLWHATCSGAWGRRRGRGGRWGWQLAWWEAERG